MKRLSGPALPVRRIALPYMIWFFRLHYINPRIALLAENFLKRIIITSIVPEYTYAPKLYYKRIVPIIGTILLLVVSMIHVQGSQFTLFIVSLVQAAGPQLLIVVGYLELSTFEFAKVDLFFCVRGGKPNEYKR